MRNNTNVSEKIGPAMNVLLPRKTLFCLCCLISASIREILHQFLQTKIKCRRSNKSFIASKKAMKFIDIMS